MGSNGASVTVATGPAVNPQPVIVIRPFNDVARGEIPVMEGGVHWLATRGIFAMAMTTKKAIASHDGAMSAGLLKERLHRVGCNSSVVDSTYNETKSCAEGVPRDIAAREFMGFGFESSWFCRPGSFAMKNRAARRQIWEAKIRK